MTSNNYSPWELFVESCNKYPENLMLVQENYQFTYKQIKEEILKTAEFISKWDFKMGGLYLPNSPQFIIYLLALNKQKRLTVPLSYQLKGESLCERINYSDIEFLITDDNGFKEISRIQDRLKIKCIVVLQSTGDALVHEYEAEEKCIEGIKEGTFGICFTGGSTSQPKGVVLSNYAVSGNALAVAEVLNFTCNDRFLMARPFTQAGPIASDLLMAISCGASIVILGDLYHPGVFLKAIQDFKPTTTYLVRTLLAQILEYPQISKFDRSSIKRIILGAMITPESVFKDTKLKFENVSLYNAYGLSEASVRVSFADDKDVLSYPGTVGKTIKGCSITVYRDDGRVADAGEIGEIYVKTDYIMDGYYKLPKQTAEAITEKGLRTKDNGYVNEQGLYFIVGRADDLIIQGGNNVYPIEIEQILLMNPAIKEAVVLGIDDEKLGQKIVAIVRALPDSSVTAQELYKWCRANLEDRKIPREIKFVENIPRNEMGKLNRNQLKSFYKNELQNRGN
jgi:acyl-CoA synthetase (AMP-forming)/AMP-acid ligase II